MANLRVNKITSTETFETTGSVQFDGTGDYLKVSGSGTISDGNGDFTIEGWVYKNAGATNAYFFDGRPSTGADAGNLLIYITGNTLIFYRTTSHIQTTIELNKWIHIALTRESDVYKLWIDGSLKGTHTDSTSVNLVTTTSPILGTRSSLDSTYTLNGFISNFRIIKGKAIYTSNFKPPMRELELTPETIVLACQSKTDASLEKTGKTITVGGNAVASELTPGILTPVVKAGGGSAITGSVEFDGNYDGLVLPKSTDFAFGTGDFTIEGWFNVSDTGAIRTIFDSRNSDNASTGIFVGINSDDNLYTYGFPSGTGVTNYGIPKHGEWHHFAVVRNGSNGYAFLNGIKVSGSTNTGSTNYTDQGATIGQPATVFAATLYRYKGFLSNIRVNKGTALYTADFIPPTRELKRVPGTVLLCCQDPNNPLTEATGKTITGYGDLHEATDVEMLTNGSFAGGYSTEWEAKNSANLSHANGELTVTSTQNYSGVEVKSAYLPSLVAGRKYVMTIDLKSVTNTIRFGVVSGLTVDNISTAGRHSGVFTASAVTEVFIEKPTGSNSTFVLKSVSIRELNTPNRASNFTPQVGDDRKVTFEGVTKIDTDAYFYLPTGDTASREATGTYNAGTRGIFGAIGVYPNSSVTIHYSTIATFGNTVDFGDLNESRRYAAGCSSKIRGLFGGGVEAAPGPSKRDSIDYITIATTGNANDFGDLTEARWSPSAFSNATRGIWFSGNTSPANTNVIDYVTIASTGNASDFGDTFSSRRYCLGSTSDTTRGIDAGGHPASKNVIQYVTIASAGNAQDFGDLMQESQGGCGGVSNGTRGVFAGGYTPTQINTIQYITIQSMGNSKDFGDMTSTDARHGAAAESSTRGLFTHGGYPSRLNTIDAITIATTGNAVEFGDIIDVGGNDGGGDSGTQSGFSNGHGGLG